MAVKPPVPEIPVPVWRNFKDLQEWEQLHQERPEGDKHSSAFVSITEGIHNFPGGFVVTTVWNSGRFHGTAENPGDPRVLFL